MDARNTRKKKKGETGGKRGVEAEAGEGGSEKTQDQGDEKGR